MCKISVIINENGFGIRIIFNINGMTGGKMSVNHFLLRVNCFFILRHYFLYNSRPYNNGIKSKVGHI